MSFNHRGYWGKEPFYLISMDKKYSRFKISGKLETTAAIVTILFFIISMVTWIKSCSESQSIDTLEKIKKEKKLKVGYIPYYEITSKEAKSGKIRGFLVDVLFRLISDLKISKEDVEFFETDWQNFGNGLKVGKYDLSIAGTFCTPERMRIVLFTEPLFYLGNGALVRSDDNRFQTIEDFNREDITIAVIQGEQGYEYAQEHLPKAKKKILTGSDLSLACLEVEKGLVDAALSDQYILKRYSKERPSVKDLLAGKPYHILSICWAVRKDDLKWHKYLNKRIKELKESAWFKELQRRYSMIPWAPPPPDIKTTPIERPYIKSILDLIRKYLPAFTSGIFYTLLVSFFAIILGTALGALMALILASGRQSIGTKTLKFFVRIYIYSFLAIPALVLIIMFYYNSYISYLNSVVASILALGLNLSPFAAKVIYSGIRNIPPTYLKAAKAFGYNNRQIILKFKLPLVKQNSMQPLLVQWFTTVKLSSLASVIGVTEVLHRSQQIIRETYRTELAYVVLIFCYVIIVIPISLIADHLEKVAKERSESE